MKRRDFVKGVAIGSAAGTMIPVLGCSTGKSQDTTKDMFRNEAGEYVELKSTNNAVRSGMALGGIGAGTIELRKNGIFYNWNIFNNYPKETGPKFELLPSEMENPMDSIFFFKVRYQIEGQEPVMKVLQISDGLTEGGITGTIYYHPWMSAVQNIEYKARYPFIEMKFSDPEMPFDVFLNAWTPFIPHDVKNSSLPLAYFDFKIKAKTDQNVDVMLVASLQNNVGYDQESMFFTTELHKTDTIVATTMSAGGMDEKQSTWGQLTLGSLSSETTYYLGWSHRHPYYEQVLRNNKLPNIDDTDGVDSILKSYSEVPDWMPLTKGRNKIDPKTGKKEATRDGRGVVNRVWNSLAISGVLKKKDDELINTFTFTWNFPNLYGELEKRKISDTYEGHYYNNYFNTAFEVAQYAVVEKPSLYSKSKHFIDHFFDSSLDIYVLEQVNSQLNTFVTSGRLVKDGSFGIQEGLAPNWSWGPIATIDVSVYGSVPIIALFPELQKSMMRCHKKVQAPGGEIQHGLYKNFHRGEDETWNVSNRIDLPSQFIGMTTRDFFWTNDKAYLEEMWPSIKKAIDYILNDLDLNKDLMPEMEGPRSSYDNFPMYGLASYIQSQWLNALASVQKAAVALGDKEMEEKAAQILQKGGELMDQHLWNGEYYRLYNDFDGTMGKNNKDEGCLTDQIIGQWVAHQSDLGYLFDQEHIHKTMQSILKYSFKNGGGLRNCSWPGTKYWEEIPKNHWVDQGNTYWTGVELGFASFLLYEGYYQEALQVIKSVDDRYRKANLYWDHQEFGGHYYRPMSAWGIVNGALGFAINQGMLVFNPKLNQKQFKLFFSTPDGTAHYSSSPGQIEIKCLTGILNLNAIKIKDLNLKSDQPKLLINNNQVNYTLEKNSDYIVLKITSGLQVMENSSIIIS